MGHIELRAVLAVTKFTSENVPMNSGKVLHQLSSHPTQPSAPVHRFASHDATKYAQILYSGSRTPAHREQEWRTSLLCRGSDSRGHSFPDQPEMDRKFRLLRTAAPGIPGATLACMAGNSKTMPEAKVRPHPHTTGLVIRRTTRESADRIAAQVRSSTY